MLEAGRDGTDHQREINIGIKGVLRYFKDLLVQPCGSEQSFRAEEPIAAATPKPVETEPALPKSVSFLADGDKSLWLQNITNGARTVNDQRRSRNDFVATKPSAAVESIGKPPQSGASNFMNELTEGAAMSHYPGSESSGG